MIVIDLKALKAAAERVDMGPAAVVSRAWLSDVADALADPTRVMLLSDDAAPTPMVVA